MDKIIDMIDESIENILQYRTKESTWVEYCAITMAIKELKELKERIRNG